MTQKAELEWHFFNARHRVNESHESFRGSRIVLSPTGRFLAFWNEVTWTIRDRESGSDFVLDAFQDDDRPNTVRDPQGGRFSWLRFSGNEQSAVIFTNFETAEAELWRREGGSWEQSNRLKLPFKILSGKPTRDGDSVVLCQKNGKLSRWSFTNRGLVWSTHPVTEGDDNYYVAIDPKDRFIVTAAYNNIETRKIDTGEILCKRKLESASWSLAISPNGRYVATGGTEATLWRVSDEGVLEFAYRVALNRTLACAFSPDSRTVAFTNRQMIYLFDLSQEFPGVIARLLLPKAVKNLAITQDGIVLRNRWVWTCTKMDSRELSKLTSRRAQVLVPWSVSWKTMDRYGNRRPPCSIVGSKFRNRSRVGSTR